MPFSFKFAASAFGLLFLHIILFIVFALIRIGLMMRVEDHYDGGSNTELKDYLRSEDTGDVVFNAFYQSMLVQTGWGALDIVPISKTAKAVGMAQAAFSFLLTTGALTFAGASALVDEIKN